MPDPVCLTHIYISVLTILWKKSFFFCTYFLYFSSPLPLVWYLAFVLFPCLFYWASVCCCCNKAISCEGFIKFYSILMTNSDQYQCSRFFFLSVLRNIFSLLEFKRKTEHKYHAPLKLHALIHNPGSIEICWLVDLTDMIFGWDHEYLIYTILYI